MCLPTHKCCFNAIERGAKVLSDPNKFWIIWFLVLAVLLCHLILFFVGCGDQQFVKNTTGLKQSTHTHSLLSVMNLSLLQKTPSPNPIKLCST